MCFDTFLLLPLNALNCKIVFLPIRCLIFVIPAIIFVTVTIAEACQFSDKRTSWEIYQVVTSPIEIFAPFIIIFRSDQLKTHSIRFLRNKYNDLFMFNIYFVPAFMFIAINLSMYIIFKLVNYWYLMYYDVAKFLYLCNCFMFFSLGEELIHQIWQNTHIRVFNDYQTFLINSNNHVNNKSTYQQPWLFPSN